MSSFNVVITTKGSKDESDALYERRTVAEATHACLYRDASNSIRGTGPDWWLRVTFAGHISGKGWAKFPLKHAAAMVLNHTDGDRNAKASHVEFTATYEHVRGNSAPVHITTILLPIGAMLDQLLAFMKPREVPKPPRPAAGEQQMPPDLELVMTVRLTHKGRLVQRRGVPWFSVAGTVSHNSVGHHVHQVGDTLYFYAPAKKRPPAGGTPDGKLPLRERLEKQEREDDEFARVMRERALLDASRHYDELGRAIRGGILHAARTYVTQERRGTLSFTDAKMAEYNINEFSRYAWEQACDMVRLSLVKAPDHGTR